MSVLLEIKLSSLDDLDRAVQPPKKFDISYLNNISLQSFRPFFKSGAFV